LRRNREDDDDDDYDGGCVVMITKKKKTGTRLYVRGGVCNNEIIITWANGLCMAQANWLGVSSFFLGRRDGTRMIDLVMHSLDAVR
jgi:hypothetical protein